MKLDERAFTLEGPMTSAGRLFLTLHKQSRTLVHSRISDHGTVAKPSATGTVPPGPVLRGERLLLRNDNGAQSRVYQDNARIKDHGTHGSMCSET